MDGFPVAVDMLPRVPVIVVLGATGSGKSKLAIEIAMKYGGEILSADSMQVYKGLDVVTNKVTAAERRMVPHHLIDCVDPLKRFTVVDYRNKAVAILDKLLSQGKMPVVVGGTNYYIESLLWRVLVEEQGDAHDDLLMCERDLVRGDAASAATAVVRGGGEQQVSGEEGDVKRRDSAEVTGGGDVTRDSATTVRGDEVRVSVSGDGATDVVRVGEIQVCYKDGESPRKRMRVVDDGGDLEAQESEELHKRLRAVDPDMARRLHPNDKRKIIRSLNVLKHHGRTHSSILRDQREVAGGSDLGGPLRYPDSCILWLQCEQEVLDKRLDERVDAMLDAGMVSELLDFHRAYNEERLRTNTDADYTTGIFQSIGFKEFHPYLMLSAEERETEVGQKWLRAGVDELKLVTKRYARKQVKWIVNRFLRRPDRQLPAVFALDASDPVRWDADVNAPAMRIVDAYLRGQTPPADVAPLPIREPIGNEIVSETCAVCKRVFVGSHQWAIHLASKKHHKVLRRLSRANQTDQDK